MSCFKYSKICHILQWFRNVMPLFFIVLHLPSLKNWFWFFAKICRALKVLHKPKQTLSNSGNRKTECLVLNIVKFATSNLNIRLLCPYFLSYYINVFLIDFDFSQKFAESWKCFINPNKPSVTLLEQRMPF